MTKTMAEVLAEHYIDLTKSSPDNHGYCICGGWVDGMDESWDEHQAENLSAAGFGLVADAGAKALEDAADDPKLRLSGHSGISITRLRARAATVGGIS